MAFGRIKKRREKKRQREMQEEERRIKEAENPQRAGEELRQVQEEVTRTDLEDQPRREEQREKSKEQAREEVTTELPGLTEQQKLAMRETANRSIDNQIKNYTRAISSRMGSRGVRGGAAEAPQLELAKQGLDAQNQFERDLIEKDSDVALRRLAAYMASLEGKTSEDILRRQQLYDYITSRQDRGRNDVIGKRFDRYYRGI